MSQRQGASEYYSPHTFEGSKVAYGRSAEFIALLINSAFNDIEVPKKTIRQWKEMFESICVIDRHLDVTLDNKRKRDQFVAEVQQFVRDEGLNFQSQDHDVVMAVQQIKKLSQELSEDEGTLFFRLIWSITKTSELLKQVEDPHKAVKRTLLEGS